jgi:hypothetical protein
MATEHSCLDHEKYLAQVPPEVLFKRLQLFRLDPTVMAVLPFICRSFSVEEPFANFRPWIHPLVPRTLDDLKNWFGVPNEVAKLAASGPPTSSVVAAQCCDATLAPLRALPMMQRYDFLSLDHQQQCAVRQKAQELLYGYVDPEAASRPPLAGVINYMLDAAVKYRPNIFVAPNLIVCPGDVVEFKNVPALYFNNILIYGNGRIVTKSKTKIHAYQIRHIDV